MKKRLILIFCLSLVAQFTFMFFVNITIDQDASLYYDLGKNFALGKGLTLDGELAVNAKPLYCLILAAVFKIFGENVFIIKVIQAILIALTCIFVFKIATLVFSKKIAFWSAFITTIYPPFWAISSHLISESLFIFLLALSIYMLLRAENDDSTKLFIYSAIFLGLSTQARSTSTFLPLFIFIMGLLRSKMNPVRNTKYSQENKISNGVKLKFTKRFILIFIIVMVCMTPWTIRNYITYKIFRPIDAIEVIWQGTYIQGSANPDNPRLKHAQQQMLEESKDYIEFVRNCTKAAIKNLKEHPFGYLTLFPIKFVRLWIGSYSNIFDISISFSNLLRSPHLARQHLGIFLFKSFNLCLSFVLLSLGLIGMFLAYRWEKWSSAYILFSVFVYFSLLHMITFAEPRYGVPALPYLIIFAIFALSHFLTLWRMRNVSKE